MVVAAGELPPGLGLELELLYDGGALVVGAVDQPVGTLALVLEHPPGVVLEGAAEPRVHAAVVLTQVGTGEVALEFELEISSSVHFENEVRSE